MSHSREPPPVPAAPSGAASVRPRRSSVGLISWEEVRLKANKQAEFTHGGGHRPPLARLLAASAPGPRWMAPRDRVVLRPRLNPSAACTPLLGPSGVPQKGEGPGSGHRSGRAEPREGPEHWAREA